MIERDSDALPTLDRPDDDPRLWLETIDGEEAIAWVTAQNVRTLKYLEDTRFKENLAFLEGIYTRPDRTVFVDRHGGVAYHLLQDAAHKRGLLRRSTWHDYLASNDIWTPVLDLDKLATDEDKDWFFGSMHTDTNVPGRALVVLSRGGSDATVIREFDLEALTFVDGGFMLPEARQDAVWLDRDSLLVMSTLGGRSTVSGYYNSVRVWNRGTDFDQAKAIFEVSKDNMRAFANFDSTANFERILFVQQTKQGNTIVHTGDRNGPKTLIDMPDSAWLIPNGEYVVINIWEDWTFNDVKYPGNSLLFGKMSDLINETGRFEKIFEQSHRRSLQKYFWCGDKLWIFVIDNLDYMLYRLDIQDDEFKTTALDMPVPMAFVRVWTVDTYIGATNGEFFMTAENTLSAPQLFLIDSTGKTVPLNNVKPDPAPDNYTIERHNVRSSDGEIVTYTQVGPAPRGGPAPVLIYGYGGFGIASGTQYNSAVSALWLKRGGIFVLAHIRGGGEFGPAWYNQGIREGKRLSHDDFAAIAADLVARGVATPATIVAEGISNGGLLIGNRYPDRFGALFCSAPLTDMRRYATSLGGAMAIHEYGDPDDPKDWTFMRDFSAYHNVKADENYPPILVMTSRRDDRVHPAHARKFVAKLQALGHRAWFFEMESGGHGYGNTARDRAFKHAMAYTFLSREIARKDQVSTKPGVTSTF